MDWQTISCPRPLGFCSSSRLVSILEPSRPIEMIARSRAFNCKRCFEPTFSEFGEQVKVGAKGAPTYVDFRAYAYVEAGGGSAAAD
jgi:hypothetical protein